MAYLLIRVIIYYSPALLLPWVISFLGYRERKRQQ